MAMYGRGFTLQDANDNGVAAPVRGAGIPGDYTREAGILAYYEVYKLTIAIMAMLHNTEHIR